MKNICQVMLLVLAVPALAATPTPPPAPSAQDAKKAQPAPQVYDSNRKPIPPRPGAKPGPGLG